MPAPTDPRSPERIRHHFEVERELASRLRASSRDERTKLFGTLYTELFERVPDHPRLTRRQTAEESTRNVEKQLRLIRPYLKAGVTLLEIAPGDCRLGHAAAPLCEKVIGVDISDQRDESDESPQNFQLAIYDGYHLDLPDESVDVAFSYQFLEHLHPDDVGPHFELVHRLLKPGGVYVFDTPHSYSGPHDVSRFFGDTLECFHFQEWNYRGMRQLVKKHGFTSTYLHRRGKERRGAFLNGAFDFVESLAGLLPKRIRRRLCSRLFPAVTMTAVKDKK